MYFVRLRKYPFAVHAKALGRLQTVAFQTTARINKVHKKAATMESFGFVVVDASLGKTRRSGNLLIV